MLLPALGRARDAARHATCKGQLKDLLCGFMFYAGDNQDWGPASVYWGSGQVLFHDNVWIHQYFRVPKMFACPATDQQATASPVFRPGTRDTSRQFCSYFLTFGSSDHWDQWDFYGWHHYWPTAPDSQYRAMCPNTRFLGKSRADVVTTTRYYYVGLAHEQPMILDAWNGPGNNWAGYGLPFYPMNNHAGAGRGLNFICYDGHAEWKAADLTLERYRAYSNGYYW